MAIIRKIIIYPRSGNHMVREVLRSLSGKEATIEHDVLTKDKYKKQAYVFRDPLDAIYSYHEGTFTEFKSSRWDEQWISERFVELKTHMNWYLKESYIVLSYENLIEEIETGVPIKWLDIARFMEMDGNWKNALKENQKEATIRRIICCSGQESAWINQRMLSEKYDEDRQCFRSKFYHLAQSFGLYQTNV